MQRCEELQEAVSQLQFPLDECAIHGDAHIKNMMISDAVPFSSTSRTSPGDSPSGTSRRRRLST
ncbi:hypothetical protein FHX82_001155 [Amycolatopsis bartoniae]|nr:hypothetical protein [Amycolatopsis bartoniae]